MGKRTALYDEHLRLHARVVPFGGWDMPLHYGSQIEEHQAVRLDAGVFDVSHMGILDIQGKDAKTFLQYLLANNINKLTTPGKALYGCMLNEAGGVIDDLITYFVADNNYRLVINAITTEKDLQWIQKQAKNFEVSCQLQPKYAMIAIQGPNSISKTYQAFPELKNNLVNLKHFHFFMHQNWFIAKTGYTGEDGVEVILPIEEVVSFWRKLLEQGIKPCGLGARDTLRLEAGLNLYGQDMDETVTPLESNLAWTVALNSSGRHFIGRKILEEQLKTGVPKKLCGIMLQDRGVLRSHQKVFIDEENCIGEITSGTFSPTLKESIGFARLDANYAEIDQKCWVDIRGKHLKAKIVKLPFVTRRKNNE